MYQLKENQQQSIRTLHEQGWSKRRIAWEPGLDRATVRKYLARVSNRRLEFELGAGFEGACGLALVSVLSQASVSPEWPLVKASIIAGAAFPVAAAVRDFYETAARLIE
jgi:hypothetical protein